MTARRALHGIWLGRRPYAPVQALQHRLCAERADGQVPDTVLLLEHTPVVTLGRGADPANVLLGEEALRARGIDCERTSRGGDVTLHAPGQLVIYPIVDLRPERCDVRRYVRDLMETMRRLALRHGVSTGEVSGKVGLWVDRASVAQWPGEARAAELAKIGAIGVRVSRWVTMHGCALNLTTAADLYRLIVPCGIREHGVTSILELTGREPSVRAEAGAGLDALASVLGADVAGLEDWSGRDLPLPPPEDHPGVAAPPGVPAI
jgi:lipoyl(octanoyl) transferase